MRVLVLTVGYIRPGLPLLEAIKAGWSSVPGVPGARRLQLHLGSCDDLPLYLMNPGHHTRQATDRLQPGLTSLTFHRIREQVVLGNLSVHEPRFSRPVISHAWMGMVMVSELGAAWDQLGADDAIEISSNLRF